MIDDFELEARRKKIYTDINNKWRAASKGYLEKIEEMKLKNERKYKERDREFKQKLRKKELSIKKQIELKNEKILQKVKNLVKMAN